MNGKLNSDRGETLVETLASILIASLSVTLLFGAVMASGSMDRTAQKADDAYYQALSNAESRSGTVGSGKINISNGSTSNDLEIDFYGGEDMYSYARQETGP